MTIYKFNRYWAEVLKVTDGDTLKLRIDLGFNTALTTNGRVVGINTHEIFGKATSDPEEYRKGMLEKAFVENWVQNCGRWVVIESHGPDKYGNRWDVRVFSSEQLDAEELTQVLIKNGMYKDIPTY